MLSSAGPRRTIFSALADGVVAVDVVVVFCRPDTSTTTTGSPTTASPATLSPVTITVSPTTESPA